MVSETDELELAVEYVETAFAVMSREPPVRDGRMALGMCAHWFMTGAVASLADWRHTMNPLEPHGWPADWPWPPAGPG